MSLFDSTATRDVLLSSDILSEPDRISSIWDKFTSNIDDSEHDEYIPIITSTLKSKFIDKFNFSNEKLEDYVNQFCAMVDEICTALDESTFTEFLSVLANSLRVYGSSKNETIDNREINVSENVIDISRADEIVILSTMERYDLLESNQLEGLLDGQMLELMGAEKMILERLGAPEKENSGANYPSLTLKDLIPNIDEITKLCKDVAHLNDTRCFIQLTDDENHCDLLKKINIKSPDDIGNRFFHPSSFLSNSANLGVVNATIEYLRGLSELDTVTAFYILNSTNDYLDTIIRRSENHYPTTIFFSQMLVVAYMVECLKYNNPKYNAPGKRILSEGELRYLAQLNTLTTRLKQLADYVENNSSSAFEISNTHPDRVSWALDGYVEFVSNSSAKKFSEYVNSKKVGLVTDYLLSDSDTQKLFQEINSFDPQIEIASYYFPAGSNGLNIPSSPKVPIPFSFKLPKTGTERAEKIMGRAVFDKLVCLGKTVHDDFNRKLIDGDYDGALVVIARETVLRKTIDEEVTKYRDIEPQELVSVKETLERDVSVYSNMLKEMYPNQFPSQEEEAKSYIENLIADIKV